MSQNPSLTLCLAAEEVFTIINNAIEYIKRETIDFLLVHGVFDLFSLMKNTLKLKIVLNYDFKSMNQTI